MKYLILTFFLGLSSLSFSQKDSLKQDIKVTDTIEQKMESKIDIKESVEKKDKKSSEIKFTTSDIIAGISGFIALFALFLSIISTIKTNNLAKKDFLLTHRPFVWVDNFGYLNNQNIIVNPINKVMYMIINSPAKFHNETIEYYIIDNLNNKTVIESQELSDIIRYPSDKSQYTNTSGLVTDQIAQGLANNQEMERVINIEYSWLSSEKKYTFYAKWRLNKQDMNWQTVEQNAN